MSKLVALVVTAALIVFGFMFSVLLIAFIVTAGAAGFAYLWYKTRALRRLMREQAVDSSANDADAFKGEIIEGEVIHKVVTIDTIKR